MNEFHPINGEEQSLIDTLKPRLIEEVPSFTFHDIKILRFLRGRKHDVEKTFRALVRHAQWYEENKVPEITEDHIPNELASNKVMVTGVDSSGRSLVYVIARRHFSDKRDIEELKKYIIFSLEKAMKLSNPEEERMIIIFDLTDFGFYCMDYEGVKVLIEILSHNYPDTLHTALIVNSPMIFSGCWMVIKPWLDPVTAGKCQFVSKKSLTNFLDPSQIPPDILH
jgi:hypothetical protein